MNSIKQLCGLFFIGTMVQYNAAMALSSDQEQPVFLEADRVDIDQKTGTSTYNGHVELIRGSMQLRGNKMTVSQQDQDLDTVVVTGEPARYQQKQDNGTQVRANAARMEYFSTTGKLHLYENATVWQGEDSFNSDYIVYDTAADMVTAGTPTPSDQTGNDPTNRVKIVIQPRKKTD